MNAYRDNDWKKKHFLFFWFYINQNKLYVTLNLYIFSNITTLKISQTRLYSLFFSVYGFNLSAADDQDWGKKKKYN